MRVARWSDEIRLATPTPGLKSEAAQRSWGDPQQKIKRVFHRGNFVLAFLSYFFGSKIARPKTAPSMVCAAVLNGRPCPAQIILIKKKEVNHEEKCECSESGPIMNKKPKTIFDKQSQIAERKTGNGRGPGNHSHEAG